MGNIKTRLISTNQNVDGASQAQTPGAAFSLAIAPAGTAVTLLYYSGYCAGTASTNYWLMFFPQQNVPANGAVPMFKQQILGADGFVFNNMPKGLASAEFMNTGQTLQMPNLGGLICCLSTTDATLTLATGSVLMDLDVFIEEYETLQPNVTTTGDLSTLVKSLAVWTEANGNGWNNLSGAKQLLRVWYSNRSGFKQWLQLFAQDAPVTNSATLGVNVTMPPDANSTVGGAYSQSPQVNSQLIPVRQWEVPASTATSGVLIINGIYKITTFVAGDNFSNVGASANATGVYFVATGVTPTTWSNGSTVELIAAPLDFGQGNAGIDVFSIDNGTTQWRIGCSLFVSTTRGYLTAPGAAGWYLRAQYK